MVNLMQFLRAIGWGVFMAGFSSITFIGSFIFLKYAPEAIKAEAAFSYSLYSYLGGLLGLLIYNGFQLTDEQLGREVRLGVLSKMGVCIAGVALSEKVVVITNILRIGLSRQGVNFKFSITGFILLVCFLIAGVCIFFILPELAWRYFYYWVSILPILGMFSILGGQIWLPINFSRASNKTNVCLIVFKRMVFDVAMVLSPIVFLLTAKASLDAKEQVIYFQCVSAFGVCGIFSMLLESIILKKGAGLNVQSLRLECIFWLFTFLVCFFILNVFFSVGFLIALLGATVSFFLMMSGSLIARMRLKENHSIFVKHGFYVILFSVVICGIVFFITNSLYVFLAAVLVNTLINVCCYWREVSK